MPKELVRRGLDDGTERLRGQLRETAQRGQASAYGGDHSQNTDKAGKFGNNEYIIPVKWEVPVWAYLL